MHVLLRSSLLRRDVAAVSARADIPPPTGKIAAAQAELRVSMSAMNRQWLRYAGSPAAVYAQPACRINFGPLWIHRGSRRNAKLNQTAVICVHDSSRSSHGECALQQLVTSRVSRRAKRLPMAEEEHIRSRT